MNFFLSKYHTLATTALHSKKQNKQTNKQQKKTTIKKNSQKQANKKRRKKHSMYRALWACTFYSLEVKQKQVTT